MAAQPPTPEEPVEEPPSEPLKYKTWLLRVSVHCEGCKRKVKRILHGIEGVYTVDVDTKLHKATVTGNVDPETLIRKLEKSGKHAELWQDHKNESKRSKKKKNKDKRNDQDDPPETNTNNDSAPGDTENHPQPTRIQLIGPPSRAVEVVSPARPGGGVQFKEVRVDANGPENPPAPENLNHQPEGGGPVGNGGGGGGGGSKRRKKKKGNNSNSNGNSNQGEQSGNGNGNCNDGQGQPPPGQCAAPMGEAPPAYRGPPCGYPVYNQPPPYYGPPMTAAPGYGVSYNTAYPTSSYTASFYAGPPLHSYAYVQQGSDSVDGGPSPSETFEIFSDENPNACSVM